MARPFALIFSLSLSLFAAESIQQTFSVEQNPGTGTLRLKQGDKEEVVQIGTLEGHYALGMFLRGNRLPPPMNEEFKDLLILQTAFGNIKAKHPGLVPQFGTITLASAGKMGKLKTFKLRPPMGREPSFKDAGLLLFTSAKFPLEQNDQDKLKGTYIAKSGDVVLRAENKPDKVELPFGEKSLTFNRQTIRLDISGELVTPFNPQDMRITGRVEFPVYWPVSPLAEKLVMDTAAENLSPLGSGRATSQQKKRDVSGQKK